MLKYFDITEFDHGLQENPKPEVRFSFISNREIRHVPLNFEHPQDERGVYVPLFDHSHFSDELVEEYAEEGPEYTRQYIESWHMPDFSDVPNEQMGICAYESTSEGTPISPVFPNTPQGRFELLKYCTENCTVFADQKTGIEAWAGIFGPGLALVDGKTGRVQISEPRQDFPQT